MIGGLGVPELAIIAVVVIFLFGAKKLPALGGAVGQSIKNFKKGIRDGEKQIDDADKEDVKDEKKEAP